MRLLFLIKAFFDQSGSLTDTVGLAPKSNLLSRHIRLNLSKIDFVVLQIFLKSVIKIASICPARRSIGSSFSYESMNRALSVEVVSWLGHQQRSIKEKFIDQLDRDVMQKLLIARLNNLMGQLRFQSLLQSRITAESAEKACFVVIANVDQLVGIKASVCPNKNRCIGELLSDNLKYIG